MATISEGNHASYLASLEARLEEEVEKDEAAFENYGGDDPHEPPTLGKETPFSPTTTVTSRSPSPKVDGKDPDKVTWDGPDDPQNPQNWSNRYRWFITISCLIMTINV